MIPRTSRLLGNLYGACALCLSLSACGPAPQPELAGNIELAKAAQWFREFDALCTEDGGELWGVSFCGPILLVDPGTRMVVGNQSDPNGLLEAQAGVFVGQLPEGVGIANTAMEWSGTRWTMLMWWSLGEDPDSRSRLMAHEAFHRLQPELGLTPFGEINAHLDTADGRFWMQMEWNALQQALLTDGDARRQAIADGLTFRAARRARFPDAAEREIPLEIFEGLAEYSGMRLAGFSDERVVQALNAKRESDTGFVRSFAYLSGPLYGYLLDQTGVEWREGMGPETDLAVVLGEALGLSPGSPDDAARRAESYAGVALRAAEDERERERMARLAAWRASLIDGPVLIVDLNAVTSGTFDPHQVHPFDENRTVYTARELIAEWGLLSVDAAAILEDRSTGRGHVSLAGAAADGSAGEGWTLELEEGWSVAPGERAGDLMVVKEPAE